MSRGNLSREFIQRQSRGVATIYQWITSDLYWSFVRFWDNNNLKWKIYVLIIKINSSSAGPVMIGNLRIVRISVWLYESGCYIITAEFKQLSKIRPNLISAEGVKIENIENIKLGMCRGRIATTGTDNNVLPRFWQSWINSNQPPLLPRHQSTALTNFDHLANIIRRILPFWRELNLFD